MDNGILSYAERTKEYHEDNPEYLKCLLEYFRNARDCYEQEKGDSKLTFKEYLDNESYVNRVFDDDEKKAKKYFPNPVILRFALCEIGKMYEAGIIDKMTDEVLLKPLDMSGNGVPAEKFSSRYKQKGLILPTGEYYPAVDHYLVSNWLMLNGKDTRSAVRSWADGGKAYFSNMQGYCSYNKNAIFTKPQAEAVFNTCRIIMGADCDLHEAMLRSYTFGFLKTQREYETKDSGYSAYSKNLNMLEDASDLLAKNDKERFSAKDFGREVNQKERALRYYAFV